MKMTIENCNGYLYTTGITFFIAAVFSFAVAQNVYKPFHGCHGRTVTEIILLF